MVNLRRKPKRFARRFPYLPSALPTVAKLVAKTILNRFSLEFRLELMRQGAKVRTDRYPKQKAPDLGAFCFGGDDQI